MWHLERTPLSMEKVAASAKISPAMLYRWRRGERKMPSIDVVYKLHEYFRKHPTARGQECTK